MNNKIILIILLLLLIIIRINYSYNNIIKKEFNIAPVKNCFGFPHFVHTIEYFYNALDFAVEEQNEKINIILPKSYKSNYVNKFLEIANKKIKNINFTKRKINVKYLNYEFNHDKELFEANFKYQNNINKLMAYKWFRNINTPNKLRELFIDKKFKNNNEIKIGIIDRKKDRNITNLNEIINYLKINFNYDINVTYFNDKDFEYQINFFYDHKIIISCHGAELCSIPFAKNNSLIIECCSNFWHPYYYFPGLSLTSGKTHVMTGFNNNNFPKFYNISKNKDASLYLDKFKIISIIKKYLSNQLDNKIIHIF